MCFYKGLAKKKERVPTLLITKIHHLGWSILIHYLTEDVYNLKWIIWS